MADQTPGTAPVTDQRTPPRGVLPRGAQTWLMAGLAVGLLAIIVFTGRPDRRSGTAPTPTNPAAAPNPDRLRDYQDRLRVLDERSRQQAPGRAAPDRAAPVFDEDTGAAPVDPLAEERRRREYESLFASNVVLSRRATVSSLSRPATGRHPLGASERPTAPAAPPSLDEVAEAVVRATARSAPARSAAVSN